MPDGRDPRRRPARGDAHDRGAASTSSPTSWAWTASSCGGRTSSQGVPGETALGIVYDSGDYHGSLDKLLEHFDVAGVRASRSGRAKGGKLRGFGFSTYTEICGLAPSRVTGPQGFGLQTGLWESAMVRVHFTGAVTVYTGTSPHGQGHETTFAQIVADRLGRRPAAGRRSHGDTAPGPHGLGTYGSRTPAVGGEALARATDKVVDKAKKIVAHMLEAAPGGHRGRATASSPSRARRTRA